jgi:uncharacterized Fe-S radical SAM superfamily protein PflX
MAKLQMSVFVSIRAGSHHCSPFRLAMAEEMFESCVSCGRFCHVDRISSDPGDWGECRVGQNAIVSAVDAHFGEEPCLKGTRGSGTIFFGACNLKCMYCQNWKISHMDQGQVVDAVSAVLMSFYVDLAHVKLPVYSRSTFRHLMTRLLHTP